MKQIKQKIWDMYDGKSKMSSCYDIAMMVIIVLSLAPLLSKNDFPVLLWIDHITVTLFIIDYALRWFTSDLRLKKGWKSYLLYFITPWSLLDLVCILPSFHVIASGFRILKIARLFRTLRVFRHLVVVRKAKNIRIIFNVILDEWRALAVALALAGSYVLIVALVMFNMEPDTFNNFLHAIYWSTISLTTIGYGDVYPLSMLGQVFTILSSFVGIAVIALPSGIIAGGFIDEMRRQKGEKDDSVSESNQPQSPDPITQIGRLCELRDKGALTEEEFQSKKAELLNRIS